jgi:Zn-dependent peptidase ImmA (M78 family)
VKVGALARALGLDVVVATLPLNISGLIKPDGNDGYVIHVNRFEPKDRQRFTIAHEIAHYLLHKDRISAGIVDSILYRSKLSSRIEAEANKLAADIVMPSRLIVQDLANVPEYAENDRVGYMAEKFGVSKQAMSIRVG